MTSTITIVAHPAMQGGVVSVTAYNPKNIDYPETVTIIEKGATHQFCIYDEQAVTIEGKSILYISAPPVVPESP